MISADTKDLEALGGDIIIRESQIDGSVRLYNKKIHEQDFKKILSDYPVMKLVLNGRGGSSMKTLCNLVKQFDYGS